MGDSGLLRQLRTFHVAADHGITAQDSPVHAALSIKDNVSGGRRMLRQSAQAQQSNKVAAAALWASTQTAMHKLRSDMNDAMNSFVKGTGSSVNSAAQ